MSLLDRIEDALAPLAADLVTSCVLCGQAVFRRYGRVGIFCVCGSCCNDLHAQVGLEQLDTGEYGWVDEDEDEDEVTP